MSNYPGSENDPDEITGWEALLCAVFFAVLVFALVPR